MLIHTTKADGSVQFILKTNDIKRFKCATCGKKINKGYYCKEVDKVYCKDCEMSTRTCLGVKKQHMHYKVNIKYET